MHHFLIERFFFKYFLRVLLVSLCTFVWTLSAVGSQEDNELESAFASLQRTMGVEATPVEQSSLDSYLQKTFDPMAGEIKESSIPVEALNAEASLRAAELLSHLPIADGFDFQYQERGMALSLALWSGSRTELVQLFKNCVSQLYSDLDQKNFKLFLNSNPLPIIKASAVDYNDELRQKLKRDADYEYHRWLAGASVRERSLKTSPKGPRVVELAPRWGIKVEISAGALASFKSVDEFAGQIAKVMAMANPQVYGYKEDIRFTKSQKIIEMIELAIENGAKSIKEQVQHKRQVIAAEHSAIERMFNAGFNPLAIAKYEERVQGWMADVFMQSKNHRLARKLLNTQDVDLEDWSRPLRLLLQERYVFHLQATRKDRAVNFSQQDFSKRLQLLRWRLKLYSKPFLMGTVLQASPFIISGTTMLGAILFPEAVAHALVAINATDTLFAQKIAQFTETGSSIGSLVQSTVRAAPEVTTTVLNSDFLSATWQNLTAKTLDHLQLYESYYEVSAFAISMTVAGAFVVKNALSIKSFFLSMKQSFDEVVENRASKISNEREKQQSVQYERSLNQGEGPRFEYADPANRAIEVVTQDVGGSISYRDKIATSAGTNFAKLLNFLPRAPVLLSEWSAVKRARVADVAERTSENLARGLESGGMLISRGKDKVFAIGNSVRESRADFALFIQRDAARTREHLRALQDFATAGYRASIRAKESTKTQLQKAQNGAQNYAISSWRVLGELSKKAPDVTEQVFDFTLVKSAAMARGLGIAGRYIFWQLPASGLNSGFSAASNLWTEVENSSQSAMRAIKAQVESLQERSKKLREGIYRREAFLNDDSLQPAIVLRHLQRHFEIIESHQREYSKLENLNFGISKDTKSAHLRAILIQLFDKWLQQEKFWGAKPTDFSDLISVVTRYWRSAELAWLKEDKEFENLSMKFYRRIFEKNDKWLIEYLHNGSVAGRYNQNTSNFELFLAMRGEISSAVVLRKGETIVGNIILAQSAGHSVLAIKTLSNNSKLISESLSEPSMTIEQFRAFDQAMTAIFARFNAYFKLKERRSFSESFLALNSFQKAKIEVFLNRSDQTMASGIARFLSKKAKSELKESVQNVVNDWIKGSANVRQLVQVVETTCAENQIDPKAMSLELWKALRNSSHLIQGQEDLEILFSRDYFWSEVRTSKQLSPLELPLQEVLRAKREQFGHRNSSWSYDPLESEISHAIVVKRLEQTSLYPSTSEGKLNLYKVLTRRGVSTITDDLLSELLKNGSPSQIAELETLAVVEGRVFDQGISDEFAIRQVKKSEDYQKLFELDPQNKQARRIALESVIRRAQFLMSDLGVRYVDFLEELSALIKSDYQEAEMIHVAKAERYIKNASRFMNGNHDTRVTMLTRIVAEIKKWKPKDQYDFLLYLRGGPQDKPTPFIEEQFSTFGPERVRKIFQGLPLEAAMTVVNLYLKETLLARKNVNQGYGRKLIQYIVSNDENPEVQEYSTLLLEGLLHGIAKKDERFQIYILSSLIAMKPSQKTSVGETMKLILEQFPGVGPKIGQFLVGTGLLSEEINRVLIDTQDQTLPQKRFDVFSDLARIVGRGENIGITLGSSLGEGSLKYSYSGVVERTLQQVALQVFREDVQNNSDFQVEVLNGMIDYLIKKDGKKWAFLRVIVDGAMAAVQREKQFSEEARKTAKAKKIYSVFDSDQFTIRVPQQSFVNERLLVSGLAKGGSYLRMAREGLLDAEDKLKVGIKILEMEAQILFNPKDEITVYDTDRHSGNYLIFVEAINGRKHYSISPIDFGQLTSITKMQKENVGKLFALAGLLGSLGANDWTANKVGQILNIQGPMLERLRKNLPDYFPLRHQANAKGAVVKHYFSLLAAINETVSEFSKDSWSGDFSEGKLNLVYTDFVRAIIQLNQYEMEIEKFTDLPKEVRTPMRILDSKAKDMLAEYSRDNQLSLKQSLAISYLNGERWVKSKWTHEAYQPVKYRFTRMELENVKIMAGVSRTKEDVEAVDPSQLKNSNLQSGSQQNGNSQKFNEVRILSCQKVLHP